MIIKPRNALVQHVVRRSGAGSHTKSTKSKRRAEKMNLRKETW